MVFNSDINSFDISIFQKKELLMEYISTRSDNKKFSFSEVFLKGLADDGGLFVPLNIKKFDESKMNSLKKLNYIDLATEII